MELVPNIILNPGFMETEPAPREHAGSIIKSTECPGPGKPRKSSVKDLVLSAPKSYDLFLTTGYKRSTPKLPIDWLKLIRNPSSGSNATRRLLQHAHCAPPPWSRDYPTKLMPAHNYPRCSQKKALHLQVQALQRLFQLQQSRVFKLKDTAVLEAPLQPQQQLFIAG
ncbi:hypothetical protein MSG28_010496 [Choristoneura fumiferana]|uniref:Uncharacterized protein n=1 Tax=Choristoneura fumiferana TaxID=7141 RepID=A0ACC0KLY4_CHOFU|nr:hypothetical protein MSG28_010496 [Choristoneura fumiferana]